MHFENKKRNRGFNFYRRYYLGFTFIAGIMILALTIDLIQALSPETTDIEEVTEVVAEVATETLSTSPVSVTHLEDLVSGCSLSNWQSMNTVIKSNLVAGLSLETCKLSTNYIYVVTNDIDIVTASYEDVTEKETIIEEEQIKKDKEKKKSSVPEYDTLEYNLAKLIDAEGSILDDYCQQLIAYCFLNRMRSNHWKNTFNGVLNDGIGYHPRTCEYVADSTKVPSEKAQKNAKICLKNHYANTMPVPYNLVYQAGFKQGTVYYYEKKHNVYFCLADKLEPN